MVDVSEKSETHRVATSRGTISMNPATYRLVLNGSAKKGDVLGIARVAAIQASKRTSDLIPLCHPIALSNVVVDFEFDPKRSAISILVIVSCVGRTGVEMEALTAASVGLLTIYDMCKSVDRGMSITSIFLVEKIGGKSGHFRRISSSGEKKKNTRAS